MCAIAIEYGDSIVRAFVDPEDAELVAGYRWHILPGRYTLYAASGAKVDGTWVNTLMHRLVMGLPPGRVPAVDHRDRNGLNNRRSNLRVATSVQNGGNSVSTTGRSRFKGVSALNGGPRWRAMIGVSGRRLSLGCFDTEEDAARAYDDAARERWGEFALTNFAERG